MYDAQTKIVVTICHCISEYVKHFFFDALQVEVMIGQKVEPVSNIPTLSNFRILDDMDSCYPLPKL